MTVRWEIPMNDQSILIAKKKFVIVKGMLNDRLNRTRMNESSAAVLDNSGKKTNAVVLWPEIAVDDNGHFFDQTGRNDWIGIQGKMFQLKSIDVSIFRAQQQSRIIS